MKNLVKVKNSLLIWYIWRKRNSAAIFCFLCTTSFTWL